MTTYIRFEHGQEDRIGDTYGPFEWVQIRYGEMVVSPDGDTFAGTDKDHCWRTIEQPDVQWADVIIFGDDKTDDGTEGQDREGYSDTQDRESYSVDEDDNGE